MSRLSSDRSQAGSCRRQTRRRMAVGPSLTVFLAFIVLASLDLHGQGRSLAQAAEFTYEPPGALYEGSGEGRPDAVIYRRGMRFPLEASPAYLNSQVWGLGGFERGEGSQCAEENYSYPWRDNYCEERSWRMPLCPAGTGHQGQDIRPGTCERAVHWAVVTEAGTITRIGSYTVYLVADDGAQYRYLHLEPESYQVQVGDRVTRGQRIGQVSNAFFDREGNRVPTTTHLHFDINQNVDGRNIFIPTYASLVASYKELLARPAEPCPKLGPDGGTVEDAGPCFTLHGPPGAWTWVPASEAGAPQRMSPRMRPPGMLSPEQPRTTQALQR